MEERTANRASSEACLFALEAQSVAPRAETEADRARMLQLLLECQRVAAIGGWMRDVDTGERIWTAETYRLFGVSPEVAAPKGDELVELVHPSDHAAFKEWLRALSDPTPPLEITFRVPLADGTVRVLRGRPSALRSFVGYRRAVAGTVQDVTAEYEAETALRLSEARARQLFDAAIEGIVRISLEGVVLDANPAMAQLLGFATAGELVGMNINSFYAAPEQRHDLRRVVDAQGVLDWVDLRMRRADGQERIGRVSSRLLLDPHGGPSVYQSCVIDVTEERARAANEAAARARELQFDLAVEATRIGIWCWDFQTNSLTANARWGEILGYAAHELESLSVRNIDVVHPDDRAAVLGAVQRHIDGEGAYYEINYRVQHRDGRWLDILSRGKVFERDGDGKAARICGVAIDVTDQKRAERAAIEANRAKTHFLATMTHELRTPLAAILGLSDVVLGELQGPLTEKQKRSLTTIHQSGRHLLSVVNDVLDVARIEAGQLSLDLIDVDVTQLIGECIGFVLEAARARGQRVLIGGERDLGAIPGDPKRLRQVMVNLLTNAIKFSPPSEAVMIGARRGAVAGTVELWVSDKGPGISPGDRERIFEPFVQLDTSLSREGGGVGLGLSLVKRLVELHGGSVRVEAEPLRGALFVVTLPVVREHLHVPPSGMAAADGPRPAYSTLHVR